MKTNTVGYWSMNNCPQDFIDPSWSGPERDRVIDVLHLADVYVSWMGYAGCRICRHPQNGTTDHTIDGLWVWPEGYLHYIKKHNLRPPQEFVEYLLGIPQEALDELAQHKKKLKSLFGHWNHIIKSSTKHPESDCQHELTDSGFICRVPRITSHNRCVWASHQHTSEVKAEVVRHHEAMKPFIKVPWEREMW